MKRDWEVIRGVLSEVEAVSPEERNRFNYSEKNADRVKLEHALLLLDAGYIEGTPFRPTSVPPGLLRPTLTWQGHELLDTIRSKTVWERIKTLARDKGVELTFESIKVLAVVALKGIVG
jgi:hypothetical protein